MARSVRGLVGILVVFAALAVGGGAGAIVGGSADTTHTYVGAATQPQVHNGVPGTQLCTGALISPTVFLTAAHCFPGGSTATVTFASNFRTPDVTYSGTVHDSPDADVAVIVFESPITDVGLAPAAGSRLRRHAAEQPARRRRRLRRRGVRSPGSDQHVGRTAPGRDDSREERRQHEGSVAQAACRSGRLLWRLGRAESRQRVEHRRCNYLQRNANCKGVSSALRVDTPVVRGFLEDYVSLP
jgi:hypothetical protein